MFPVREAAGAAGKEREMMKVFERAFVLALFILFVLVLLQGCGSIRLGPSYPAPEVPAADRRIEFDRPTADPEEKEENPEPVVRPTEDSLLMDELRRKCWSVRLEWHYEGGWSVIAKQDVGALASRTTYVTDPDLVGVLKKALADLR